MSQCDVWKKTAADTSRRSQATALQYSTSSCCSAHPGLVSAGPGMRYPTCPVPRALTARPQTAAPHPGSPKLVLCSNARVRTPPRLTYPRRAAPHHASPPQLRLPLFTVPESVD
eukprot:scaffold36298_cov122-Isochrysis_galbana.AAC.2